MKRILSVILSAVMAVLLISGCQNDAGRASQSNRAGQQTEAGGSVVVVMDPSSSRKQGLIRPTAGAQGNMSMSR